MDSEIFVWVVTVSEIYFDLRRSINPAHVVDTDVLCITSPSSLCRCHSCTIHKNAARNFFVLIEERSTDANLDDAGTINTEHFLLYDATVVRSFYSHRVDKEEAFNHASIWALEGGDL